MHRLVTQLLLSLENGAFEVRGTLILRYLEPPGLWYQETTNIFLNRKTEVRQTSKAPFSNLRRS